jgi:hypothetical protein
VISGESGVSCDPDLTSPRRTTPLSAAFWGGCNAASVQRLVTVNNSKLNQYAALAPAVSQRLAIVNSNTYGGSGGAAATATGGNASHDPVTVTFRQTIGANDALRTGAYAKTLTFTLTTTSP